MNKIDCDICLDLMPLVIDGVASEQSERAVFEHTATCQSCKEIFETYEKPKPDDGRVLKKIKSHFYKIASILVVFGILFGVSLMISGGEYYNILIMPAIGGVSYFVLKQKLYIVFIAVFAITFVRYYLVFVQGLKAGFTYGFIYCGLILLGVLIGFLFDFGLRKEKVRK